jgi:hypothetical protein
MRRYLRLNDDNRIPTRWIFFDVETTEIPESDGSKIRQHKFRLGVARYVEFRAGKLHSSFYYELRNPEDIYELIDKMSRKDNALYVCSHNLYFDLTATLFWSHMEKGRYSVSRSQTVSDGTTTKRRHSFRGHLVLSWRPTFLYVCGPKGRIHFVDSLNYTDCSLATIGESIGYPKLDMPSVSECDLTWASYCRRDVEVLSEFMTGMLTRWHKDNLGVWQPTAAGLAMTSYRHMVKKVNSPETCPKILIDDDKEKIAFERLSYFGGQTQCYYLGKVENPVHSVDVNGLYPYVMRMGEFPYECCYQSEDCGTDELRSYLSNFGVVAAVRVCTSSSTYPVRCGKRVLQAVGTFWTVLCGAELERAISSNHVDKVGRIQCYKCAPIFRHWVDYWWRRRVDATLNGDKAGAFYVKRILNSLSGKFAQSGKRWVDRHNVRAPKRWGEWTLHDFDSNTDHYFRSVAGNAQELIEDGMPQYCFPAISAFITAAGREYMRTIRLRLPERSVYHQATDSFALSGKAYNQLKREGMLDDSAIGKFKSDGSGFGGEFEGVNHYRIGSEWTMQGLYGRSYRNDDGNLVADIWQRLPEMVRVGPGIGVRVFSADVQPHQITPLGRESKDGWINPPELWLPTDRDYIRYLEDGCYQDAEIESRGVSFP